MGLTAHRHGLIARYLVPGIQPVRRRELVTFMLIVSPLVVALYALIVALTHTRYPPQSYYLKKKRGATLAMAERRSAADDRLAAREPEW